MVKAEFSKQYKQIKALEWIEALRAHRGTGLTEQELIDATDVIKDFDLSKINQPIRYSIKEKDSDAVKRGDMETAQRMVNEAAEIAGYRLAPKCY